MKAKIAIIIGAALAPACQPPSVFAGTCTLEANGVVYEIADWDPACNLTPEVYEELETIVLEPPPPRPSRGGVTVSEPDYSWPLAVL